MPDLELLLQNRRVYFAAAYDARSMRRGRRGGEKEKEGEEARRRRRGGE
jgi:hypothetical protein